MAPTQAKRGCLLLHGFTGGPFEVMPLAEHLALNGWDCRVPVLPGHEEPDRQMAEVRCTDWLDSACEEAEELVRKYGTFDLVGFSMGGMLSIYLASRYPVRKLALLSAAAIYISPVRFLNEWVRQVRNGERSARMKIRQTPLKATLEFMKLVRRVRPELNKVKVPTLILQGMQDHIVHPYSARYLSRRLQGEPEVRYFADSQHLLCRGPEAQQVSETVYEFFNQP